jgi:hypothetical protein
MTNDVIFNFFSFSSNDRQYERKKKKIYKKYTSSLKKAMNKIKQKIFVLMNLFTFMMMIIIITAMMIK